MNALAAPMPAASEGLVFLPYLAGAGQPENDPDARGVFYGITLKHGKGHFARAIQESIGYMLRKILASIAASGVPVEEIRSMGGGARSDLWLQIKADITGLSHRAHGGGGDIDARRRGARRGGSGDYPDAAAAARRPWSAWAGASSRTRRMRRHTRGATLCTAACTTRSPPCFTVFHDQERRTRMQRLKAGYVSFGTQYYKPDALRAITERAEKQLRDAGIELVRTDPVTGEGPEPERAIRELGAADWDFLIANVINWIDVRGVMRVLLAFRDKPMVLYSFGGFTEDGTLICPAAGAGCTAIRYPMERMGLRFKYLFNAPDSPMDVKGIAAFGAAARAARLLRSTRLGMVGFNDMGLYTTDFSVTKLRSRIGPEVESVDMLQLERRHAGARRLPRSRPRQSASPRTGSIPSGSRSPRRSSG